MNIRRADINDINRIKELLEKSFSKPFPLSLLKWKYFENPYHTMNFVAERNGKIICHYGAIFFPFSISESSYICMPCDAAADQNQLNFGKNLPFVKFSKYVFKEFLKFKNVKFIFSFTGERHRRLSKLIINGRDFHPVIETKALFEKILLTNYFISLKVEEASIDDLIENKKHIGIKKDREFFKWRYEFHPLKIYKFFKVSIYDENIIFLVIRVDKNCLNIEDFIVVNGFEFYFIPSVIKLCKFFSMQPIKYVNLRFSSNNPVSLFVKNSNIFKLSEVEPNIYPMYFGNMNINIPIEKITFTMAEMEL